MAKRGRPRTGRSVSCPICGKVFYASPSKHKIYCSKECAAQALSIARKGPRVKHICPICGRTFVDVPSRYRQYCSSECMAIGYTNPPATCLECGGEFQKRWSGQDFCSTACSNIYRSREAGYHISEITTMHCENCGHPFEYKTKGGRNRRFCSRDCSYQWHRGENHAYWQGGYDRYYGPNWRKQREKALERDSHRCQECGEGDGPLDVHHIIPRSEFGKNWKQMNHLSNLLTLCHSCHARLHLSFLQSVPE